MSFISSLFMSETVFDNRAFDELASATTRRISRRRTTEEHRRRKRNVASSASSLRKSATEEQLKQLEDFYFCRDARARRSSSTIYDSFDSSMNLSAVLEEDMKNGVSKEEQDEMNSSVIFTENPEHRKLIEVMLQPPIDR